MTENLTIAVNEKDVENTYRHNLIKKFKDMEITSPFGCDGFGVSKTAKIRTLMEFKDDFNLSNKTELAKVLCQSIFYIKRFYDKGIVPPSTIFVADRNECTVLHVNDVIKYLEMDLNWSTPPSQAHTITELLLSIVKDENIKPFIYSSNNFAECVEKIKDLTDNVQRRVLVTDKNITEVFRYFDEKVLGKNKLTTNERANLFVQILVNKDDNYLHPVKKRKTVVTKSFGEVSLISRDAFESFFGHFSSSYTPSQKHKLAAVVDRIIEDTTRRKQGEFFTPAIWVDKAHEYIASVYGEDWKEKYIVWDPAWGTGNLTRDYKFKELYVSTLNQSDIDTANQMGYNPEAVKFQYDFLNDDYEKLPVGLRNAIENGKEIIVLMNPPYGTANDNVNVNKDGMALTKINEKMKEGKWGPSSQQLYTQFLFRINFIGGNFRIGCFTPPLFLSGESYKSFRKKFFENFIFSKGFLMNAKNFDGTSEWGISFTIFDKGVESRDDFNYDVLETSKLFTIENVGEKVVYNTDNSISLSDWFQNKGKVIDFPTFQSALSIKESKRGVGVLPNSLGTLVMGGNNINHSTNSVFILTGGIASRNGKLYFNNSNFMDAVTIFSSRKLISQTWINQKDEYLKPKTENVFYEQFKFDSVIYSLFNSASNQSSLRQVEYKDQLWDIKNEFFWMSVEKMKELADQNGYDELYNDARTSSDRYVHKLLFGEEKIYDKLSPDAKLVLDKATELVEKSMELRQVMANDENHLNSWDAGYAQLKLVWKEYFQEDFKEFRQLYKNLEDRMRPLVYELGFLKK